MNNKQFKKKLISGAVAIALATTLIGNTNVEAKKRNHKPTLSFKGKLKNKKKMTVKVGDKVYVKGKAKDKEDGNITRKIKVKVTKPKNGSYKKKGNYITFKKPGNYKVKLNVKDSDKKSTSLSRTITVKSASLQKTTPTEQEVLPENNTIVTPTEAPVTTPTPTEQEVLPENNTTVTPTYVTPTETPVSTSDLIMNNENIHQFTSDSGYTYNVDSTKEFFDKAVSLWERDENNPGNLSIQVGEHNMNNLLIDQEYKDLLLQNEKYMNFFGPIMAKDENGNDISNNIVICNYPLESGSISNGTTKRIMIYVCDENGNEMCMNFGFLFHLVDNPSSVWTLLCENPTVYYYSKVKKMTLTK